MGRVSGKVALVTGAASGLGKADATLLAEEGATVVITDLNETAGRALAQEINSARPGAAFFMVQDVASESGWQEVFAEIRGRFGALHVLVNNAGMVVVGTPESATHLGYPVFYAYSAAKGAVRSMTKSIAVHCQMNKYNIRCNSIHAGAIETPMVVKATQELGMQMTVYDQTPVGLGKPQDVANLVLYLASDESRFVNAAEILIDNGLIAQ